MVYSTPVIDLEDLRRRIVGACATVTWRKLERCRDICRATKGAHIEIYQWPSETLEVPLSFATNGIFIYLICMGGSPGDVSEELVTQDTRKKGWRMNCDVGEATERWENKL